MSYINIIADDKDLIVYRKNLRELCKSVTGTILFSQLLYWFKQTKNQPFYKFIQPCNQNEYKQGDSWTEELGFSYLEFTSAFSQIGKKYNSKTEMKSDEKINDYMFYAYTDKIERKTYYHINLKLIENNLSNLYNSEIKNDIPPKVGNLGNLNSRDEETLTLEMRKPKSDYITETTSETTTDINTSTTSPTTKPNKEVKQTTSQNSYQNELTEIMNHWNNEFPRKKIFVSKGWEKNYTHWREAGYSIEQVKQAISNIWEHSFWCDKLDLTKLLRTKDTNKEDIDRIAEMLSVEVHKISESITPSNGYETKESDEEYEQLKKDLIERRKNGTLFTN